MSVLKSSGYGDGRKTADMPNGTFFGGPESGLSPRSATGIVVDGVAWTLEGQPPLAQVGNWGDLSWTRWHYGWRGVSGAGITGH